jgi:hypothetical protein
MFWKWEDWKKMFLQDHKFYIKIICLAMRVDFFLSEIGWDEWGTSQIEVAVPKYCKS